MLNKRSKDSQLEFFEAHRIESSSEKALAKKTQKISLSLESILILTVCFVMSLVVVYSLGFEMGKKSKPIGSKYVANTNDVQKHQLEDVKPVEPKDDKKDISIEKINTALKPMSEVVKTTSLYTIQVMALKDLASVEKQVGILKSSGLDAFYTQKNKFYLIFVGKFESFVESKQFLNKIKSSSSNKFKDSFIRRLEE